MTGTITFVGGGNMATAMVGGLIGDSVAPTNITIVEPNENRRVELKKMYAVHTSDDVGAACKNADTIILAVKPHIIPIVAETLTTGCDMTGKLVISIAAGITLTTLEDLFGDLAFVRAMPNTPALVGCGATGIFTNAKSTKVQIKTAMRIMESFGICVQVDTEGLLDAVTALSGSGPAYFFLLMEEMISAGEALGLSRNTAQMLTVQTALGAAKMADASDVSAAELRARVTSPNGTTQAAIVAMQTSGFSDLIQQAMTRAKDLAVELGRA